MPRSILLPCAELCSAYLAGQSTTVLSRRYACSPTTIAKNLRMCGITLRVSRFAPVQIEELSRTKSSVVAKDRDGRRIRCKHVVFASGYEFPKFVPLRGHRDQLIADLQSE